MTENPSAQMTSNFRKDWLFWSTRAREHHITRKNIYNNNNKTGLAHKINVGDHAEKQVEKEMKSLRYSQIVHQFFYAVVIKKREKRKKNQDLSQ